MAINPEQFHLQNVTDTCSVWNLLSSKLLYARSRERGCSFCCTEYVKYELLIKKRKAPAASELALLSSARQELDTGRIRVCAIEVEDLQQISALADPGRLHRGELSTIAFALRTGQAVLTDDQAARRFAADLGAGAVQTVPHLLAWLVFHSVLDDAECAKVISDHTAAGRPLAKHLSKAVEAARLRRLTVCTTVQAGH